MSEREDIYKYILDNDLYKELTYKEKIIIYNRIVYLPEPDSDDIDLTNLCERDVKIIINIIIEYKRIYHNNYWKITNLNVIYSGCNAVIAVKLSFVDNCSNKIGTFTNFCLTDGKIFDDDC